MEDTSVLIEPKYKPEYSSHGIYTPDTGHVILSIVAAKEKKVIIKQIVTL